MAKIFLISLFFLVSTFLLSVNEATACSCMRMTSCEAYARAKIVFTGKIVKGTDEKGARKHQVQVEENFLGMENTPLVNVYTDRSSSCAFEMPEGTEYLIFAWKNEETGEIWTGMCSHTTQIEYAKADLDYLRSVKSSVMTGGTIKGSVVEAESDTKNPKKPEQINKVFVEKSDGQKFEADIQPDGSYELTGLVKDKYAVSVSLPKGFITGQEANSDSDDEDIDQKFIEVPEKGCVVKDFEIKINGIISGKVFDANGIPVKERRVSLFRFTDPNKINNQSETVEPSIEVENDLDEPENNKVAEQKIEEFEADFDDYTNEDGSFIFKGLPPGRYLLGFEIGDFYSVDTDKDQYLPTYFPSSKKKETALVIELKKAEVSADKNIQLFPKLKKRKITGQIIWKNGRTEPKARGDFYIKREGYGKANWGGWLKIDKKGNFTFEGFEETEYLIKAWFEKPISPDSSEITHSSKCFIIPKNGLIKPIKLTLENGSNCDESEFRNN